MKAIVLKEIGKLELRERDEPRILEPRDAIVRVTKAGICGSDLHIISGRDPGVQPETIMGHEFTGVVVDIGEAVSALKKGDRVFSPFTTNCGACFYCLRGLPARCVKSEAFGFHLDGSQAEYIRVPLADSTLMPIPPMLGDLDVLFLGDIFSTAYSAADAAGIQKNDVVAIIGCGPVGLLAIKAAKLLGATNIVVSDTVDYRLEKARSLGAIAIEPDVLAETVRQATEGRGADAIIEAVGVPAALDAAMEVARPGAVISIAGYHTEPIYSLPINLAYRKNLTFRIGRCNARKYMSALLPLVQSNAVCLTDIVTHTLPLNEGIRGYEIFEKRLESAIKVVLVP